MIATSLILSAKQKGARDTKLSLSKTVANGYDEEQCGWLWAKYVLG